MGLKSGENGVKALLQARYSAAFRRFPSIGDLRKGTETPRQHTVIVADGNVLMMQASCERKRYLPITGSFCCHLTQAIGVCVLQIPQSVVDFRGYVSIVSGMLKTMLGSANLLAIVFDEPCHMTAAKREEQMRRDASRGKREVHASADLDISPRDDAYTMDDLRKLKDCHALIGHREARQRFFDAVMSEAAKSLQPSLDIWKHAGHEAILLFDGLDPRGADREIGEERQPMVWSTNHLVGGLFQRVDNPIGEGDLKLSWFEKRLRSLVNNGQMDAQLLVQSTIDTDSFAITLVDVATRAVQGIEEGQVKGALVMRERANKRDAWGDEDLRATYLCCDYAALNQMIQRDMWQVVPSNPTDQLLAMRLLTTAWAMCGSDFVAVAGLRADIVLQNMKPYTSTFPEMLARFSNVLGGIADVKSVVPALKRMVLLCADQAKLKKHRDAMQYVEPELLLRACWTAAYWNGNEQTNTRAFGFSF